MGKGTYAGIAVILLLVVLVVAVLVHQPTLPSSLAGAFLVQLTDPPQVPNGTQSLLITYSSVQLHSSSTNGFINLNESGSVDLLKLVNLTQTIGIAHVPPNATFDLVRFNVTSAKITIDNQTYNVSVPNSRVTINMHANGTSGGVLIDFTPAVIQIYSANQTIFVLVPSAKAIVIGRAGVNATTARVGAIEAKSHEVSAELEASAPNITVVSASASVSGNVSTISVTVRNSGNRSVTLKHLMIFGNMEANMNASLAANSVDLRPSGGSFGFNAGLTSGATINSSRDNGTYGHVNAVTSGSFGYNGSEFGRSIAEGFMHNISTYINASGIGMNSQEGNRIVSAINASLANLNATQEAEIESMMGSRFNLSLMMSEHEFNLSSPSLRTMLKNANAFMHNFHGVLNFVIGSNGTLSLPFQENEAEGPNGYVLNPGQSATLSFSGAVHIGPSALEAHGIGHASVAITLIPNQTYSMRIIGEEGAFASANAVAS